MKKVLRNGLVAGAVITVVCASHALGAPIDAPDMTDASTSVTNVFGAVLGVAVLIFGFKKVKGLL